jgi:hypothetical protein
MPSLYVPQSEAGYIHAGAPELDRQLREGDGLGWPGDPRLYLAIGVVRGKNPRTGQYGTGRRYEVRRENEDGTDTFIAGWRLEEFDRILFDLAPLRMGNPGHVDTTDLIDAENKVIEDRVSREIRDNLGAAMEYGAHLIHDRTEPGNVFRQVGGFRDDPSVTAGKKLVTPEEHRADPSNGGARPVV